MKTLSTSRPKSVFWIRNNKAGILPAVLWIVFILSVQVFVTGQMMQRQNDYLKKVQRRTEAKYALFSGLNIAAAEIKQRETDETKSFISSEAWKDEGIEFLAFEDNNRRLNLNSLTMENKEIFMNLLQLLDTKKEQAERIALDVLAWRGINSQETKASSFNTKNRSFDVVEELQYIPSISKELYKQIKPHLTVFPQYGNLNIDWKVADKIVLKALAMSFAGAKTNTEIYDADSLVEKLISFREKSASAQPFDIKDLFLNAKERSIFVAMTPYFSSEPQIYFLKMKGWDKSHRETLEVEALINRNPLRVLSWKTS